MKPGDICKNGHAITETNITTRTKTGHGNCKICVNQKVKQAAIAAKQREQRSLEYLSKLLKSQDDEYTFNSIKKLGKGIR